MKKQECTPEKDMILLKSESVTNMSSSKHSSKRFMLLILFALFTCFVFYLLDGEYKESFDKGEFILIAIYALIGGTGAYQIYKLLKNKTRYALLLSFISVPVCIWFFIFVLILLV